MSNKRGSSLHYRWAELRFAIVGPLLASPPTRGELAVILNALSKRTWIHPATGEPVTFGASTIEHWYYQARNGGIDRFGALRKKNRKGSGPHPSKTPSPPTAPRARNEAPTTRSAH